MKIVKSILKSFCYVGLFYGMQLLVSFVAQFVYGVKAGIESRMSGVPIDAEALTQGVQAYLLENQNWLLLFSGALTLLFLWVFFKCRKKSLGKEIQMNKLDKKMILPLVVMGCSYSLLVTSVLCVIPLSEDMTMSYTESTQGIVSGNPIVRILVVMLLTPVVEEVIFRGLIFTRLKRVMKAPIAVVLSSLLFGLMHGHIIWISYTFIGGIMFALVMEKTNSLKAAILLHMALNSISAIIGGIGFFGIVAYIVIGVTLALVIASLVYVLKNGDANEYGDLTCNIA